MISQHDIENTKAEDIISSLHAISDVTEDDLHWLKNLQKGGEGIEDIERQENKDIIKMRTRWSDGVLFLIFIIVIFDMVLVSLVGMHKWSFTNTSIVIAVIVDNFLKIVGLGYLITTEIFKKIYPRK
jgi:nitrate reductase NapE component